MLALMLSMLLTLAPADRLWLEAESFAEATAKVDLLDATAPDFGRMASADAGGQVFLRLARGGTLTYAPVELAAGTYTAWIRAFAMDGRQWTMTIDDQPVGTSRGGTNVALVWLRLGELTLPAGQHTVVLHAAAENINVCYGDAVYLTTDAGELPYGRSVEEVMRSGEVVERFADSFDAPAGELSDAWQMRADGEQWARRVQEDQLDCLRTHNGSGERLQLHLTKPLRVGPARQVQVTFRARRYGITESLSAALPGIEEAWFNLRRDWTSYERTFLVPPDAGDLVRLRLTFRGGGDTLLDDLVVEVPDPPVEAYETGRFLPPPIYGRGGRLFELERYLDEPERVTTADVDADGQWALVRLDRDANEPMFSRGTVLKSDTGETTPPLHCTLTGLAPGPYSVWTCDPGRPVTFQLDGGPVVPAPPRVQTSLGQITITDGKLGLTVRKAAPEAGNPGPAYLDYVLLIPTENAAFVDRPAPVWKDSAPDGVARGRVDFRVRQAGVRGGGVPLPPGALGDPSHVRAMSATGELPCQTKVLCRWPEGSIKWLFVVADTPADGGWIEYGSEVKPAARPRAIAAEPRFGAGPELWSGAQVGQLDLGALTSALTLADDTVLRPANVTQTVQEAGPLRWVTRLSGDYTNGRQTPFSFEMVVTRAAGEAALTLEHTFITSGERAQEQIKSLVLRLAYPHQTVAAPREGHRGSGRFRLLQDATNPWAQPTGARYRLTIGDQRFEGDAAHGVIVADGLALQVDDFAEQYPLALSGDGESLMVELWPADAADGPFVAHRGMSKTHTIRLGTAPVTPVVDWLRCDPVALRQAGIFGEMPPAGEATAAYDKLVDRAFDELIQNRAGYGMENWGDMFQGGYIRGVKTWSNQEWDLTQSWLIAYARTGDPRYLDFADASARHFADVDCIHAGPPTQLGGARTHCHTSLIGHQLEGPNLAHSGWVEGLLSHYYLTGCERSLRAAVGIGDWTVQAAAGRDAWGPSGPPFSLVQNRPAGWPLVTLSLLYQQTRDPAYLATSRRLVDYMRRCQIPGRGCWEAQTPHEEPWRGGCVFAFTNFRGLKLYAQITGEAGADRDRAAAGRWLVGELWRPHDRYLYEQCPAHEPGTDVGFLQWETLADLTALTGDPLYLMLAVDGFERRVAELPDRMVGDLARAQWSNGTMQQAARMLGVASRLLPARPGTVRFEAPETFDVTPGKAANVALTLVNDGDVPLTQVEVTALVRGDWQAEVADAPATVPAHGQATVTLRVTGPPALEVVERDNDQAYVHALARFGDGAARAVTRGRSALP